MPRRKPYEDIEVDVPTKADWRAALPKISYIIRTSNGVFFSDPEPFTRLKFATQKLLRQLNKDGVIDQAEWDMHLLKLNDVLEQWNERFNEMKKTSPPHYRTVEYAMEHRRRKEKVEGSWRSRNKERHYEIAQKSRKRVKEKAL